MARTLQKQTLIRSEAELKAEALNLQYDRDQRIKNAFNRMVYLSIYIVPLFVAVLGLSYLLHLYLIGDWSQIKTIIASCGVFIVGFITSELRRVGINNG